MTDNPVRDGRNDFDFFMGQWKGHNRRLRERLKGSTEWEEFECESTVMKILAGAGNFDEVLLHRETGDTRGATLRLYDKASGQWSIYWADGIHGRLEVPVVGTFKGNRGEFYSQESYEGQMIFVRFTWIAVDENHCRWEQAFSTDGGKTWETNWTVDFTRLS